MLSGYTSAPRTSPDFSTRFHGTHRHADRAPAGSFRSSPTAACSRITRSRSISGRILAVAADGRGAGAFRRRGSCIERPTHVLLPGFVNAHTHAAMTLLRGAAESSSFDHWLNRADPAAGAALDGCRVRPRRHRAGDRRHADQRHHLLRRHAPVPGSRRADRRRQRDPRLHRPAGRGHAEPAGPARPTNTSTRAAPARRVSRRSADHDRASRRDARSQCATRRCCACAARPTSWSCR